MLYLLMTWQPLKDPLCQRGQLRVGNFALLISPTLDRHPYHGHNHPEFARTLSLTLTPALSKTLLGSWLFFHRWWPLPSQGCYPVIIANASCFVPHLVTNSLVISVGRHGSRPPLWPPPPPCWRKCAKVLWYRRPSLANYSPIVYNICRMFCFLN